MLVISRTALLVLIYAFVVLLVAMAVLGGFSALSDVLRDAAAGTVLRWSARVCLALWLINAVLLVLALAVRALEAR